MEIVDYVKDGAIPVQIKEGVCGPTGRHSQDRIHGAPGSGRLCAGKGAGVSRASKGHPRGPSHQPGCCRSLGEVFRPPPAAISAQSPERLRAQTCRGQRKRQRDQTSEGGL
jgi:hypothetical protein